MPVEKKYVTPLVIIAVIVVVGIMYYLSTRSPSESLVPTGTPTPALSPTVSEDAAMQKRKSFREAVTGLTYDKALIQYADRQIQFDDCATRPPHQTYKNGTQVMFDNRSATDIELRLDGKLYRVGGYEFAIIPLDSPKLPHEIQIDCRIGTTDLKNTAQILLQE